MLYLVEVFRASPATPIQEAARDALAAATRNGSRLLGGLVVPDDEVVFWLFEAASRSELAAVLSAADIAGNRVSEVELVTPDTLAKTDRIHARRLRV